MGTLVGGLGVRGGLRGAVVMKRAAAKVQTRNRIQEITDALRDSDPQGKKSGEAGGAGGAPAGALSKSEALIELLRLALADRKPPAGSVAEELEAAREERPVHAAREALADAFVAQLIQLSRQDVLENQLLALRVLWALCADRAAAAVVESRGGLACLLRMLQEGGSPTNEHRVLALDALQTLAARRPEALCAPRALATVLSLVRFANAFTQAGSAPHRTAPLVPRARRAPRANASRHPPRGTPGRPRRSRACGTSCSTRAARRRPAQPRPAAPRARAPRRAAPGTWTGPARRRPGSCAAPLCAVRLRCRRRAARPLSRSSPRARRQEGIPFVVQLRVHLHPHLDLHSPDSVAAHREARSRAPPRRRRPATAPPRR